MYSWDLEDGIEPQDYFLQLLADRSGKSYMKLFCSKIHSSVHFLASQVGEAVMSGMIAAPSIRHTLMEAFIQQFYVILWVIVRWSNLELSLSNSH